MAQSKDSDHMQLLLDHIRSKSYYYLSSLSIGTVLICYSIVLICLVLLRVIRRGKVIDIKWLTWSVSFSACLTIVLSITLLGREQGAQYANGFFSFFSALVRGERLDYYDIVFNVLMFIPLGLLLAARSTKPWWIVLGCAVCIELTQYITGRGLFEVSDLALNSLGGWIGIILLNQIITVKNTLIHKTD